jgi:hypothetical protein
MDDTRIGSADNGSGGLASKASHTAKAYAHGEERPLGGYLALLSVYGGVADALQLAHGPAQ